MGHILAPLTRNNKLDDWWYNSYRLTGVTEIWKNVSYTYGLDNLRKSKTVNGTTTGFIWNGSNMVAETNGSIMRKVYFAKSSGKIETPKSYYLFKVGGWKNEEIH